MANEWRRRLERLGESFERIASGSAGVFHFMIERRERDDTPSDADDLRYLEPDRTRERGLLLATQTLPGDGSRFRALTAEEAAAAPPPSDEETFVRDRSGKPHAVLERGVTRMGRLEAREDVDMHQLQTLSDAAARVFRSIPPDALSLLPGEVHDLALRQGPVMRRLVVGDVPERPSVWIGQGWQAGIAQYAGGVVIDYTEAASGTDDGPSLWLLLLHVLGWQGGRNSLLRARRWYWCNNEQYSYELVHGSPRGAFSREFENVPKHRSLSVIGDSMGTRTDVCWASRWAIDELLVLTEQATRVSQQLQKEIGAVDSAETNDAKGKSLEKLMRSLFEAVEGFEVRECNARTETEEIDLVLDNKSKLHPWDREGALILVECKNWSKPCGKNEVTLFESKVKNRRDRCTVGFFIAWGGFASTAEKELLRSSREGWVMVLLEGSRVREAAATGGFTQLLERAWYEALVR